MSPAGRGAILLASMLATAAAAAAGLDQLTYHGNSARTGWRAQERELTPQRVASPRFGLLWQSAPLAAHEGLPARLFASPLYLDRVRIVGPDAQRRLRSVVYAAATTGHVYAIQADGRGGGSPGAVLWQQTLTTAPCSRGAYGILGTPAIDARRQRLYVSICDQSLGWRIHALDVRSGRPLPGWPVALDAAAINAPGVNRNGSNRFPDGVANLQRGALNLDADGRYLFVTFGGEPVSGWLVMLDTQRARVTSAFSATARTEEGVGGMWASGGVALDRDGAVYVATGSSVVNALAGKGAAGVFPDSEHNWGQSILQLRVDRAGQLQLTGTYTPYNYCQAGGNDLDLGAGSPIAIDLPRASSATPRLLLQGGTKQGNVYLLDRTRLPGDLRRRPPCGEDPARDASLLSPDAQPQFGTRGPLNVFGPYSDRWGMGDLAKSRSTAAYFHAADGRHFVFVTGSAKASVDSPVSVAPGLARLEIVTQRDAPAYLRLDGTQPEVVFQNPGSPVVSSAGRRDAIIWVLDTQRPRSAPLYGEGAPQPVLHAFDALTLRLLWRSAPGQLATSGKYNEPLVVRGQVIVGTDRLQAFGLRAAGATSPASPLATNSTSPAATSAAAAGTAVAGPPDPRGALLYAARCAACHEQQRQDIPPRARLSMLGATAIVDKLRVGSMQAQALGLTDADLDAIARYLIAAGPVAAPTPEPTPEPAP